MTRRTVHAGIVASVVPITLFAACSDNAPADGATTPQVTLDRANDAVATPPNVIVIMTDDMRTDDLAAMPATRHLLGAQDGNGVTYDNVTANTPLCCPSRATLLTGQYAHNHGVWNNTGPNGGFSAFDDSSTLPMWLQASGYQTVLVGKYLNEYGKDNPTYVPPGWDDWAASVGALKYNDGMRMNVNGNLRNIDKYVTTWQTDRAVGQLNQRLGDQSLFMLLAYDAPHHVGGEHRVWAEPKYRGQSQVGPPESQAFNENDVGDKPPFVRDNPKLSKAEVDDLVRWRRERRDALRSVDDGVRRIVDTLKASGQLSNTVLIFMSDNGMLLGEHRLTLKRWPYRESSQVPLLIRGPGFVPGVSGRNVSLVDIPATITDIAEVLPGLAPDGHSLSEEDGRRAVLVEAMEPFQDMPTFEAVRTAQWIYVEWDGGQRELYDLVADPWQLRNQAGNPALKSVRTSLAAELDRLRHCAGEGCR